MKNFSMPETVSPFLEQEELERLSQSLEKNISREEAEAFLRRVPLRPGAAPEERARWVERLSEDLARFVSHLNESGAGWSIKGGALYTRMFTCECPMLERAGTSPSLTWCYCTAGYSKAFFEAVFERPVEVELLQTIKQGHDCCLLKVTGIL